MRTRPTATLTCLSKQPAADLRLVCLPHSGGHAGMFRRWTAGLAPNVEVWGATLPGRGMRIGEPFAREWTPLVAEITNAILDEVPGPIALFGHSLGGLLAFEVARSLTQVGEPPAHLVVSARAVPPTPYPLKLPDGDGELLDMVDRVYNGVPSLLRDSPDMLRHFAPILRADLELVVTYVFRPGPSLSCPITALGGEDDDTVSAADLREWSGYTSGDFASLQFPGSHFYLDAAEREVLETVWRSITPVRDPILLRGA